MFALATIAFRNLAVRALRTVLGILAVALGVGLVASTQIASEALTVRSQALATDLFGNADVNVIAFAKAGFQPAMISAIRAMPSVSDISAQLVKRSAARVGGRSLFVLLDGVDPVVETRFHRLTLDSGRWFTAGQNSEVVLASDLASARHVGPGDSISLVTATGFKQFKVVGVLARGGISDLNYGQAVFVSRETADAAFQLGGRIPQVEVRLAPNATISDFRSQLAQHATEDYLIQDRSSVIGDQGRLLAGIQPFAIGLGLLSLVLAVLMMSTNVALDVLQQRRTIGMLRAAGATGPQVTMIFLVQALVVGATGSALGIALGFGLAWLALNVIASQAALGPTPLVLMPGQILLAFLLGTALCVLSAAAPARRAGRLAPLDALQPGVSLVAKRLSWRMGILGFLGALIGGAGLASAFLGGSDPGLAGGFGAALLIVSLAVLLPYFLPALLRVATVPVLLLGSTETTLALRGLEARRTRTAITVGGLSVTCAALVALGGLSQSVQAESGQWIGSLFVSPYVMVSPVDQPFAVAQQLGSVGGVQGASPISTFSVRSAQTIVPASAIDPAAYTASGHLRLLAGGFASTTGLDADGVLLPRRLADDLHVTTGSTFPIHTESGDVSFRVLGILYHSLPSSEGQETAVFSIATAQRRFGVLGFDLLQIIPRSGATLDTTALRREALDYGMDFLTLDQLTAAVQRSVSGVVLALDALAVVGVVVALLGILNTMVVNVTESWRELALLRSIGLTRNQMTNLVLAQGAIMGISGAVLGLLTGLIVLAALLSASATTAFQPEFVVPFKSTAIAVAGLIAGSILAALLPARNLSHRSVVESLRSE